MSGTENRAIPFSSTQGVARNVGTYVIGKKLGLNDQQDN